MVHREALCLDDIVASSLIFSASVVGLLANTFALLCIYRLPSLHNSFGVLCFSNCSASLAILTIFAGWVAPATLWQWDISTGRPGKFVGQTAYYFWYSSVFSSLCISINRFVAITYPIFYRKHEIFSRKSSYKLVALIWLLAWLPDLPYFLDGCDMVYDPRTYGWGYKESVCGNFLSIYSDLVFFFTVLGAIFLLDILTLVNIRRQKDSLEFDSVMLADDSERTRRKIEINFFAQAFVSDLVFLVTQLMSNCAWRFLTTSRPLFITKWVMYAASCLSWQIVHIGIPLVLIIYNRDTRLKTHRRDWNEYRRQSTAKIDRTCSRLY